MKLTNHLNLNAIIMDLFNADLYKLKNQEIYQMEDNIHEEFKAAMIASDCSAILLILDNEIKKATEERDMDCVMFLSYFLFRYIYFFKSLRDWQEFTKNNVDIQADDLGSMFIDNIAPFFDKQIDFFLKNYTKYLTEIKLSQISEKLFNELSTLIKNVFDSSSFDLKLARVEDLVKFLQDSKRLTSLLEGKFNEEIETFLTMTNEIKVDFQSMNNLIDLILKKLKEMRVD